MQHDTARRISLKSQIAEVERELKKRAEAYPRWIRERKLRQAEADLYMLHMQAALATLKWLQANEEAIRGRVLDGVTPRL